MTSWEFKALSLKDGTPILVDLSKEQRTRARQYTRALERAAASRMAKPRFSGYHVRAAIGPIKSKFYPAGNLEYGDRQSLHAEEAAVVVYRERMGDRQNHHPIILGLIAGTPGNPATPCGNCRDLLLDVFCPELEIVTGAAEGGIAIVATLGQYLFNTPVALKQSDLEDGLISIVRYLADTSIENDPYSSAESLATTPHYRALLTVTVRPWGYPETTRARTASVGGIDLGCEYHPIYPLRDAIRGLERRPVDHMKLKDVIIVMEGDDASPPHVPYRDRQHLYEMHFRQEIMHEYTADPPIFLFRVAEDGKIRWAWETTVKQWFPLPFSPKNFGADFVEGYAAYYERRKLKK